MATTFKELMSRYSSLSMLMKIIVINVAVFVALRLAVIVMLFSGFDNPESVLQWVELPSNPSMFLRRPWTIITYMFAQYDVLHLLFNMLWLYWFGIIFMSFSTGRRLMALYVYGGLVGAALYMLAYNSLPLFNGVNGMLIGASGAVIAIVAATAVMVPDYKMHLLFLGAVSLKWVAIVTIGIDLLGVTGANAGGHLAHLGGALIGVIYALRLRRGHDITAPVNHLFDRVVNIFKPRPKPRFKTYRSDHTQHSRRSNTADATADRAKLDEILDKIKKSGYTSLTPEERKRLFDVSSRIK